MKIVAIIPARGGSKGLPKKNIKKLLDKPLISYSIELARNSQYIDKTIVSSDNKKILKIAEQIGAEIIKRPSNLSKDETPMKDVIKHALFIMEKNEDYVPDFVVLLQPTSPLRKLTTINEAILCFIEKSIKYDSLIPLYQIENKIGIITNGVYKPFYEIGKRRQELDKIYKECGTIFIFKKDILKKGELFGSRMYPFIIKNIEESIDIDSLEDFKTAEFFLRKRNENR